MKFLLGLILAIGSLLLIFISLIFITFAFSIGFSTGEGTGLLVVGILCIGALVGCILGISKLSKKYK